MDYCIRKPIAVIQYYQSDMVLYIHSDSSYLSVKNARSRAAGTILKYKTCQPQYPPSSIPPLNGAVHTMCTIINVVVSSAEEVETGGTFENMKVACPIRKALIEMGHPKPPTPIQVDNSTTDGFANETIKMKRSKTFDMQYHLIQDRVRQKKILVYYRPGKPNLADPFTKHHAPEYIRAVLPNFLLPSRNTQLEFTAITHLCARLAFL